MTITSQVPDNILIEIMDSLRDICNAGHSVRNQNKIRARIPLPKLIVVDGDGKYSWLPFAPDMVQIIKDEVNVKAVHYSNNKDLEVIL